MVPMLMMGAPRRVAASLTGEPPECVLVFNDGVYRTTNEDYEVGPEERTAIIAAFRDYGNYLAWDWEHEKHYLNVAGEAYGQVAISAYYVDLEDRGVHDARCLESSGVVVHACGLWGKVEWTPAGAADLAAGNSIYDSPLFDPGPPKKKGGLRTIVALWGCTLTSTPASNGRIPLVRQSQVAAARRVAASRRTSNASKGATMGWALKDDLKWAWDLTRTTTNKDLRTILTKVLTEIPDDDGFAFATAASLTSAPDTIGATIVQLVTEEVTAAAAAAPSTVVASRAILGELGVPETGATEVGVIARVIELKASSVPRAEHDKVVAAKDARIKVLETAGGESRIVEHIAKNRKKIPPALEPEFRRCVSSYGFDQACSIASHWKDELPAAPSSELETSPANTELPAAAPTAARRGGLPVNEVAAARRAQVEKIMREKSIGYEAANDELRRRERAATA